MYYEVDEATGRVITQPDWDASPRVGERVPLADGRHAVITAECTADDLGEGDAVTLVLFAEVEEYAPRPDTDADNEIGDGDMIAVAVVKYMARFAAGSPFLAAQQALTGGLDRDFAIQALGGILFDRMSDDDTDPEGPAPEGAYDATNIAWVTRAVAQEAANEAYRPVVYRTVRDPRATRVVQPEWQRD